jgi:hypothetical protein
MCMYVYIQHCICMCVYVCVYVCTPKNRTLHRFRLYHTDQHMLHLHHTDYYTSRLYTIEQNNKRQHEGEKKTGTQSISRFRHIYPTIQIDCLSLLCIEKGVQETAVGQCLSWQDTPVRDHTMICHIIITWWHVYVCSRRELPAEFTLQIRDVLRVHVLTSRECLPEYRCGA